MKTHDGNARFPAFIFRTISCLLVFVSGFSFISSSWAIDPRYAHDESVYDPATIAFHKKMGFKFSDTSQRDFNLLKNKTDSELERTVTALKGQNIRWPIYYWTDNLLSEPFEGFSILEGQQIVERMVDAWQRHYNSKSMTVERVFSRLVDHALTENRLSVPGYMAAFNNYFLLRNIIYILGKLDSVQARDLLLNIEARTSLFYVLAPKNEDFIAPQGVGADLWMDLSDMARSRYEEKSDHLSPPMRALQALERKRIQCISLVSDVMPTADLVGDILSGHPFDSY